LSRRWHGHGQASSMIPSPLIGHALITQISADPSELHVFPPHSSKSSTGSCSLSLGGTFQDGKTERLPYRVVVIDLFFVTKVYRIFSSFLKQYFINITKNYYKKISLLDISIYILIKKMYSSQVSFHSLRRKFKLIITYDRLIYLIYF